MPFLHYYKLSAITEATKRGKLFAIYLSYRRHFEANETEAARRVRFSFRDSRGSQAERLSETTRITVETGVRKTVKLYWVKSV